MQFSILGLYNCHGIPTLRLKRHDCLHEEPGVRRPFFSLKCSNDVVGGIPWQMDHPAAAQMRRRPETHQNT